MTKTKDTTKKKLEIWNDETGWNQNNVVDIFPVFICFKEASV